MRVKGKAVSRKGRRAKRKAPSAPPRPIPPQTLTEKLNVLTISPGVVHKSYRGGLTLNVLDIDTLNPAIKVRPMMAGNDFRSLKDVTDHARESRAIAAVNANYFKKNGTPLGTLIVDGEWIAGPIFDRVSLGITRQGKIKIGRVNLHGTLTSSNPEVPSVWVNNINQPRRHGARLIAYTRRWGSFVKMDYEGSLVAVNAQGEVVDTATKSMGIPWGGYVLSDSKSSEIAQLRRGDVVNIDWHTNPQAWEDVVSAVSGGPTLIKDGKLYVGLKEEHFRKGWTGAQIRARTAAGVTADNHLLLVTCEGPHTLWDLAKFLRDLGAVDAMNLDGGGSTTMVVNGNAVTRGAKNHQRRVASSIVILDTDVARQIERPYNGSFHPLTDIANFLTPVSTPGLSQSKPSATPGPVNYHDFAQPVLSSQAKMLDMMMHLQSGTAMEPLIGDSPEVRELEPSPKAEPTAAPAESHPIRKDKKHRQESSDDRHNNQDGGKRLFKNPFRNPFGFLGKKSG